MTYRYPPPGGGGGGQFPGGPPPGGGGQFPGGPPPGGGGFPGGRGDRFGGPPGPPPQLAPRLPRDRQYSQYAVDPGAFYGCLYQYAYIWMRDGSEFWFYPTFIGPTSIAGYRWDGFRWVYTGLDTRRIVYFQCY